MISLKHSASKLAQTPTGKLGIAFVGFSAACIISSLYLVSIVLALIGLGFAFWGALLLLIKPVSYLRFDLFKSSVLPQIVNLDKLISQSGLQGKAICLPPELLGCGEENVQFIPIERTSRLPDQRPETSKYSFAGQTGLYITPLGQGLFSLLEKELGSSFSEIRLDALGAVLRKLLVESLEAIKELKMGINNNNVYVRIEGPFCSDLCAEAKLLTDICENIGCALCSAIACALANSTGKAVSIEKNQVNKDGTVETSYVILDARK